MNVPAELRYSSEHEWVRIEGDLARIGITDYAQDALGDVVFVQLPTLGSSLEAGGSMGEIESTKSVSEVYAPLRGTVVEVNLNLEDSPQRVNEDPYGEGWIAVLQVDTDGSQLLEAAAYQALIEG